MKKTSGSLPRLPVVVAGTCRCADNESAFTFNISQCWSNSMAKEYLYLSFQKEVVLSGAVTNNSHLCTSKLLRYALCLTPRGHRVTSLLSETSSSTALRNIFQPPSSFISKARRAITSRLRLPSPFGISLFWQTFSLVSHDRLDKLLFHSSFLNDNVATRKTGLLQVIPTRLTVRVLYASYDLCYHRFPHIVFFLLSDENWRKWKNFAEKYFSRLPNILFGENGGWKFKETNILELQHVHCREDILSSNLAHKLAIQTGKTTLQKYVKWVLWCLLILVDVWRCNFPTEWLRKKTVLIFEPLVEEHLVKNWTALIWPSYGTRKVRKLMMKKYLFQRWSFQCREV